ncbi:Fe(3+) dicitrate ABC transporter ATP-binding protein FecE [Desulfatiferula olefinivorans]
MTISRPVAICAEGLRFSFGGRPVIDDLSLAVKQGECFMIIGPNGAGKSTLLRGLAGIEKEKTGSVYLEGRPMGRYSRRELARKIAFVPQLTATDFPFTVREVVMSGRAPHQGLLGMETRRDCAVVDEAMGFTDVGHLAGQPVCCLSGGERQRVFIASAICQEPSVVLMDEPTSALDPAHQIRIMDLMERLKIEKNMTLVMVMHDINLAAMYADRILVLKNGKSIHEGTVHEVITRGILEQVYECSFMVDVNPLGEKPRSIPVPSKFQEVVSSLNNSLRRG